MMKTFVIETFKNLYKITVADTHMKSTDLNIIWTVFICILKSLKFVCGNQIYSYVYKLS